MNKKSQQIRMADVSAWFKKQGFSITSFEKGKAYITSYWLDKPVSFKLTRREGYDTFYKEAFGGSLLVFEISEQNGSLIYDAYCPIWLFGFWTLKLSFKGHAKGIFRYRRQGFEVQTKFENFLQTFSRLS